MKERAAVVLIGLLAVVCAVLVLASVYPFATADPHAANPPDEQFTVRTVDAYSAAGAIVVDGEERLAFEGVVTPDGAWYEKVVEENVTSEVYRPSANGSVHERLTITGSDRADRRRESILEDDEAELVSEDRDGDKVTFVVERNATGVSEPVSGTATVFLRSLSVAAYETDGSGSSAATVYEPRSGWYEGTESYRLTGAAGEVRVDAETGAVRSADVSWDRTTPAGTYAEYVLARATSDDPTTYRVTFELDPGDADLERPPWVDETGTA